MANHDDASGGDRSSRSGILGDSVRKALVSGLSAVFSTEEGIRNALSDLRLPKEALAYVVQQTQASRREVVRIVSTELRSFLKSSDMAGMLRKALIGMRLDVHAQIRVLEDGISLEKLVVSTDETVEAKPTSRGTGRNKR